MNSLLQAGWAAAVTLALYAFYCFWEANRADLVHGFRQATRQPAAGGQAYRARAWWAAAGAFLLTLGCLASVL